MNKKKNELSINKGKLCFDSNNMKHFSLASHDTSPLHMDSNYAKQTEFGDCILFGFLGSLAGLGCIHSTLDKHLRKLEIEFRNPLFINKDYPINISTDHKQTNINILDEEKTLIAIKALFNIQKETQSNQPINNISLCNKEDFLKDILIESMDYREQEFIDGIAKVGLYKTNKYYVEILKKQFFPSDSIVNPIHIESLMLCSYIAGMILPGRRSLCIRLDMSFYEIAEHELEEIEYKAESIFYNRDFKLLGINIQIYHTGRLIAEGELHVRVSEEPNKDYLDSLGKSDSQKSDKIVISSTFTDNPILPSLKYWENSLKLNLDIKFAPYNQVFQELLNPNSLMAQNEKGMNVLLIRFGDWLRFKEGTISHYEDAIKHLNTTIEQFIQALISFSKRTNNHILLIICPCEEENNQLLLTTDLIDELKNKLNLELMDAKSIDILDAIRLSDQYEFTEIYDPIRDKIGHVPFTKDYYHLLGTLVIRRYYQKVSGGTYKVIVLDCDNTLWRGICGESGPLGVLIDDGYKIFQEFLLEQSKNGMLLCLCSKNVESDVWQVFKENTMPLKCEQITDYRINWESKSKNIKEIAKSLNLGMDSFIFIDDNPLECGEVRMNCPQVLTLQWPMDTDEQKKMVNHFWILDHYSVTEEDKMRTQMYQANRDRMQLQEVSNDYYSFLKNLNLKIETNQVTNLTVPRVAQLTQRTNQFNFSTIRRNQKEVETLLRDDRYECLSVEVEDRFGSYGLVGVMITIQQPTVLVVDTFLLSCRVLGRGVEYEMIKKLGESAKMKGLEYVKILFKRTPKNIPAEKFLDQIAAQYKINEGTDVDFSYTIPIEEMVHIEIKVDQETLMEKENNQSDTPSKVKVSYESIRNKEVNIEHIYKLASSAMGISKAVDEFMNDDKQEDYCGHDIKKNDNYSKENKINNLNKERSHCYSQLLIEIRQLFSRHLDIPFDEVDPNEELEQFHIDSYKMMDIMVCLGKEYEDIPTTLLFEHRNLESIVEYLVNHYKDQVEKKYLGIIGDKEFDKFIEERNELNVCSNNKESACSEDIAIIGINGLYPGAHNISEFWELLVNGRTSITEVPQDRWNNEAIFDPSSDMTDKSYSKWGAFIKEIDRFEATFFNIAPREAELMDPQQRLFLEVVWGLLEDAGYTSESIDRNTGVYAAVVSADYGTLSDQAALNGISAYRDSDFYQIPNRISYFFNLNGPSIAINTACSGSGTAVHLAYESLKRGECNTAIVGGINLFIHPSRWIQYAQIHFHSPDGICRPFGEGANGTVFGEGVGAILLKRLTDAVRDKDHIYGVIKATAINSGGKTNGFTVPNPRAQADIVSKALKQAKMDPKSISYIEAHGTGTALGDPIEIRGLTMAFEENTKQDESGIVTPYCAVGSIKANIGHSESSAALSGIIKILLQMKYGLLVPSLNAERLNEKIPFDKTPFYVQQKLEKWRTPVFVENGIEKHYPKRAGISSFGAGGSNSHIILEAYENSSLAWDKPYHQQIIVFSSKNKDKLMQLTKSHLEFLEKNKVSSNVIKDGHYEMTLPQMAFTLQTGRTAFEERVAFVASDIDELIQLIHFYIEGKPVHNKIYTGNTKSDNKLLKNLYDGLNVESIIEAVINEGKLYKLAEFWTLGMEVDWQSMYQDQNPGRVSLPGYSFDGEKLWIPNYNNKKNVEKISSLATKLHPMIDYNSSTLDQQKFTAVYTGEEFFLAEHIIAGNKVFPGVGYLEAARAAAKYSGIDKLYKITDIIWLKPIIVDNPAKVEICLYPTENGIEYEILTCTPNEEAQLNGQGRLIPRAEEVVDGEKAYKKTSQLLNINEIKQNCTKHIDHETFYQRYFETGCEYGNSFKAVREVLIGDHEALAVLQYPNDENIEFTKMQLHPSLMDGALQTVIAFMDEENKTTNLPFALGELELISTLQERCYAHAILTAETNNYKKYDITISDIEGNILVKIKDYSLRTLRSVDTLPVKEMATLYFRPYWKPSPIRLTNESEKLGNIIVFGEDETRLEAIKKNKDKFDELIVVKVGEGFNEISENKFSIHPSIQEHYDKLVNVLREKNKIPTTILHLWSIGLEEDPMMSVYSVYHLCQALIKLKLSQQLRFVYVYPNSETAKSPFYKALGSMLKTVSLETSRINYKIIGLDSTNTISQPNILLAEILSDGNEIDYKGEQRFVKEIVEVTDNKDKGANKASYLIKEKGTYLITGGAGGLGLLFAEYLAKTYHCSIILFGRSKLDQLKEEKIANIKKYGAEVTYIQGDISKKEDVNHLFSQVKSIYHEINGIIHCAGVIKDSYLINKSINEIQQVLAPKVQGTIWLDEATKNEPLDFFIMFSSISAVLGNPGQTDYAYANSFMDYFAVERDRLQKLNKRYGKTLSINWPLWQNGGMQVDNETIKLLQSTLGLNALETIKGLETFELGLKQEANQLMVVQGNKNKLRKSILKNYSEPGIQSMVQGTSKENSELIYSNLQKDLKYMVSDILKLSITDIDLDEDMSSFGFDSISFTGFSNRLNDKYNLHIMPSLFYEHPTLLSLMNHLMEEYKNLFCKHYGKSEQKSLTQVKVIEEVFIPTESKTGVIREKNRFRYSANSSIKAKKEEFINNEPIAIIGLSGVMPQSDTLEEFWCHLKEEKDLITEIPKDRWDWEKIYGDVRYEANKTKIKWGGFLKEIDKFDPLFFGISPREAELMDPQQRIFLEVVWKAIEDAGYRSMDISGTNTGVFVGVATTDYSNVLKDYAVGIEAQTSTGSAHSILANRVSYLLNIHGPSEPIDTACSSSLTAVHRAVEAIKLGHCDMAIAGGVNILASSENYIAFNKAGMLSEDGKCKTFDKSANGYVRGEGSGALLLKPLSKAIEDGNHIYGVIRGSDVNHGGHVSSLTTPNPNAQAEVIYNSWKAAGVDPTTIDYIEAHGTGTSLGDPIEINGLKKAFNKLYKDWDIQTSNIKHCGIGSVKTNIGHLETAAGIAGVIKVLLSFKYNQLPASIHLNEMNPYIQLDESPFYIVNRTQSWKKVEGRPRRAGVSSFGFGGTNAHVVIEEYLVPETAPNVINEPQIIILSAKNRERLKDYAKAFVHFIDYYKNADTDHMDNKLLHLIEKEIIQLIVKLMNVPEDEINIYEAIDEYGFDPMAINKLFLQIKALYCLEKIPNFGGYHSIEQIAQYILEHFGEAICNYYPQALYVESKEAQPKINLSDLAYTLQMGRDAMPERLAIIASDISMLRDTLVDYLNNKPNIENLYEKGSNNKQKAFDFIEGEEGNAFINSLIRNRKLTNIAKYWVTGGDVNWALFYEAQKQVRLSLPTYPFARDRYWVPEKAIIQSKERLASTIRRLHPLIDRNTSTLEEQKFTTVFDGSEIFFKDHVIAGNKTLPGVTYIEMARAAGVLSGVEINDIKDIVWIRPIIVQDSNIEVSIHLYPEASHIDYEVTTDDSLGNILVHGQGKLIIQEDDGLNNLPRPINLAAIKERCNRYIDKHQYYHSYFEKGYEYGLTFMPIESLYANGDEALAYLTFPKYSGMNLNDMQLPPSLMDGAFQAVASLDENEDSSIYLPFSLENVRIIKSFTESCYAYVRLISKTSNIKKYNIDIVDEQGEVIIQLTDFSLRRLNMNDQAATTIENDTLYYTSEWEKVSLIDEKANQALDNLLIFSSNKEHYKTLTNHAIYVHYGAAFSENKNNEFEINPSRYEDYISLLNVLKNKGKLPTHILHLWSMDYKLTNEFNVHNLNEALKISAYSLFHLSKALLNLKVKRQVNIIYGYPSETCPHYEAVGSMLKTIALEASFIVYKTIGVDNKDQDIINRLLCEYHSDDLEVIYKDKDRFIKCMKPYSLLNNIDQQTIIREKGVYIITGGAGGLGCIFADHLAKKYRSRLILTGRSELNESIQQQMSQLKKYGAEVTYIQADISRREEVDRLISNVKSTYSKINGVIHSAGVIKDAYLINKTDEEMNAVLAAKVFGTTWLDEATKDENLDLFVMFSSVTSVLGNAGQVDYAYGNGYMDAYAHYREKLRRYNKRSGQSIAINWPLWRDGGMKVDYQTEKLLEKTSGLTLLDTIRGIETFELSLNDSISQIMVLQGDSRKFNRLINKNQEISDYVVNKDLDLEVVIADTTVHKTLQDDLKHVISTILKIKVSDIDLEEDMNSFGFDSISFTEFSNALNDKYDTDIMPSVFYEHSNLMSLISFLMSSYKGQLDQYYKKVNGTTNNIKNVTHLKEGKLIEESAILVSKRRSRFNYGSISKTIPLNHSKDEPVAIIGLSCVMPGSENQEEFWNNIISGKDLVTEVPKDRWDWNAYKDNAAHEFNIKWGGFVKDIDKFDPLFFGISPKEAILMDPQHRMMLQNVWHSIEDAGYKASSLAGTRTGIFIGAGACDYSYLLKENQVDLQAQISTGTAFSIMANRISYQLDLLGPSEVIDTACSSSLVALHRAVESIQKDGCEMAFAAGINVLLNPETFIMLSQAGMLSVDGRCKTFDKHANGYVRGEGCGVLLLKPLSKAIEDNDTIYAVIKGSAVNHGGRVNTLTTPNPNAQADLIVRAWKYSGIDPATIGYIEAHGTGTSLGDPIEINGLKKAFEKLSQDHNESVNNVAYCGVGSVKTNIGHLEFGAGIAGVIKVLLAMKNRMLPPSINFDEMNPYIKLDNSPFYIISQAKNWVSFTDSNNQILPRRAGVSSFGFGGVNAHVALEEYMMPNVQIEARVNEPQIIILSARNEERLKVYARHLLAYIEQQLRPINEGATSLLHVSDIAYTLQLGREAMEERMALIVSDLTELYEKLGLYCKGEEVNGLYIGNTKHYKEPINLLLTGEKGSQYLESILKDKEYNRIAWLWVCGVNIDWESFHKHNKRKRIPLPTYPFAKESYWIGNSLNDQKRKNQEKIEGKGIHPLVDKNTSDFYGQKFTTKLNENAFYLAHHIVEGSKMLPGVAVLEMAYITGTLSSHQVISKIKDIIWMKPLIVNEGSKDIQMRLTTDGDTIEYSLYEINLDERLYECAQGILFIKSKDERVEDRYIDIEMIKDQSNIHISEEQCYEWFINRGLEYGASFKTIKEVHSTKNEALSSIALPDHLNHEFDAFTLHPALLDGALQSIIGLQFLNLEFTTLALPISIKEIEIMHPLERSCYVYVKESNDQLKDTQIKKYDLEIINKQGLILISIKEFMVKPLHNALSHIKKQEILTPVQNVIKRDSEDSVIKEAQQLLRKILSEEIDLPESKIDLYESFERYGINSIMIMSLNRVLESHFGKLSKTLFFEYKNLFELAAYFAENHKDSFTREIDKESRGASSLNDEVATSKDVDHTEADTKRPTSMNRFISSVHLLNNNQDREEDAIAIIGVSGKYPMANTLEEYWENLKTGKDCITEIPQDRWDYRDYYDADKNKKGKSYSKWGGFIEGVDEFDPIFFKITPKEAEYMDPQERLFLQTVWHTFEDAAYTRLRIEKEKIGVFTGVMYNQYPMFAAEEGMKGHQVAVNATNASIANRVSYYLNLSGPSMALDTMCSSSLTAIHLACESIKRGECDAALAGGVNITIHPNKYIMLSQGRFASSDGRCRSFGEGGDGYVPGEGVGAVLLKPLKNAIKDGDRIYCIIKGTSLNHGGKTNGYSVPNPNAQGDLIMDALEKARINPRTISYIEAHGTGTSLGDPIEIAGLKKAFEKYTKDTGFCSIGSSKSNIGHLESAAGIAAITKVILQMKYKILVPSIHSDKLNPNIDFEATPFYVQHELNEWKVPVVEGKTYPLRAGVSSFGAGGANAHIILEAFEHLPQKSSDNLEDPQLILLSARDEERLKEYASNLLKYIEKHSTSEKCSLSSIAYTLQTSREAMEERLAVIASDLTELKLSLSAFIMGKEAENTYRGAIKGRMSEEDYINENKQNQFKLLFDSKRYEVIAKRWIIGEEIDWKKLYKGNNNQCISLPLYPFAKEHYWITRESTNPQNNALLHPLVGTNISTLNEQCFASTFTGKEFYLADHIVNGSKMMPAAAFIEMARAAGDLSDVDKVTRIKDMMWLKPLTVEDHDKEINIRLFPYDGYVECEISEDDDDYKTSIYSKGKLFYTTHGYPIHQEDVMTKDLEKIREFCSHRITGKVCYQTFDSLGIHYGDRFKVIQELYIGEQQALARIELPLGTKSDDFDVHPVLLDGLFQTVLGVGYETIPRQLNVPFSIGEIIINGSISQTGYSYVIEKDSKLEKHKGIRTYDIYFLDELGNIQLAISDFTVKPFGKEDV